MERVTIIKGYACGGYTMYKVKPEGYINFGGKRDEYVFDYEGLADNWCISKAILDTLASCDLKYKQAMTVHVKEGKSGPEKTILISAEVVPDLLLKLRDSGQNSVLDIKTEFQVIKKMISVVQGVKE